MKYSIVSYCDTCNALDKRLDPEYWSPEALEAENSIIGQPLEKYIESGYRVVYENTKIIDKTFQKENDLPFFIQSSDIEDCCINMDTVNCVSNTDWYRYPKGRIKKGEILVEVKGNVKKVAIITDDIPDKSLVSGTLYKLSLKNISSFFVICFLSCEYGQTLKNRLVCNIATPFINKEGLYNIPIPDCSTNLQNKIENIYKNSIKLKASTKVLYKQSEELLLRELGLLAWQPKHELSYVKNFSDVNSANRYDAEYFQPKYDEIIEKIKSYPNGWDTIGNLFDQNRDSFIVKKDNKYKYVEIGSINTSNGEINFEEISGTDLPTNAKIKLHYDDVLISKVRTYRGAVAVVENSDYIGSGAFTVLHEKLNSQINKETLYTFFKLKPILDLTLKYNTGTSYPTITDEDILNMPIPIFKQNIQNEIREKIQEAKKLQTQSKQLLEIAKRGVEIAIEENEEVATSWINEQLSKIGVEL